MSEIDDDTAADPPDALEMSVAAAMARQYGEDSRSFMKSLANLLESALPGEAQIKRTGLFGGDNRPIKRIEMEFRDVSGNALNATRFAIEDTGHGVLTAFRTQVVRGITLKTETIAVESWISNISQAIGRRASSSKSSRDALRQLLP